MFTPAPPWIANTSPTPLRCAGPRQPTRTRGALVNAGAEVKRACRLRTDAVAYRAAAQPGGVSDSCNWERIPRPFDREGRTPVDYPVENLWLQGWEAVRRWQEERVNQPG